MKPTPTLIRLHIEQGYLARARRMIEAYRRVGNRETAGALDVEWNLAAARIRREASIELLKKLQGRVRRHRAIAMRGSVWAK